MKLISLLPAAALLASAPATADNGKSNDPAPGSASLMKADYATAEREIRAASVSKYDPARSINLGVALALKGERDRAAQQFRRALMENEVQVVVADGETESSHDVAHRALAALQSGTLGR
jgi:Flp pilus assembly protein TadD